MFDNYGQWLLKCLSPIASFFYLKSKQWKQAVTRRKMAFEVVLDFWDAIEVAVLEVQTAPKVDWH